MEPTPQELALVEDFLRAAPTWNLVQGSAPQGIAGSASEWSDLVASDMSDLLDSSGWVEDPEPNLSVLTSAPRSSRLSSFFAPEDALLLEVLSTPRDERDVLLPSEAAQRELGELDAALLEWEQSSPQADAALRERLRGLRGGAVDLTVHSGGRRSSQRRRERAQTSRQRRTSVRRKGPASVRGPGQVSRRRVVATPLAQGSNPVPRLALGVLASAAGLLVALAAALQFGGETPRGPATAKLDPTAEHAPRGPLVSDVQAQQGDAPRPTPTSPANPSAEFEETPADSPWEHGPTPEVERPLAAQDPSHEPGAPELHSQPGVDPTLDTRERAAPSASPSAVPSPSSPRWSSFRADGSSLAIDLRRVNGALSLARAGELDEAEAPLWRPLERREGQLELRPGDRLRAKGGGFVSLDEGAFEVCLDDGTELMLRGAAAGPRLALASGRIHCEVRSLPSGERFTVATDCGDVSVLGTIFAVEAKPEQTRVLVREGTVALSGLQGREVKIGAGLASAVSDGAPLPPAAFAPRELAWTKRFAPRRQLLYAVGFDDRKLGGFSGELERDARGGLALVLGEAQADNPYWGQEASVPQGRIAGFRPGPDVYVQFSVFVEEAAPVLFQTYNDKQKLEFKAAFHHPGGYWRTFTVPLLALSTYVDPGKHPVHEGDLFVDLEIYAGEPGQRRRVLVDDVQIYRRVYP